jgi:hypothetical protein
MESFCISDDILDLGSRRAEARAKRMRQLQLLKDPTHFDVPNVADVSVGKGMENAHTLEGKFD